MLQQGGDLSNALSNDSEGKLGWYRGGMSIALDIARGLSYLHSCKVCLLPNLRDTRRQIDFETAYALALRSQVLATGLTRE